MIKTLLLILFPLPTWERIVAAQRKWVLILLTDFLPLLLIVSAVEGYGLVHLARSRGEISRPHTFSPSQAVVYEALQVAVSVVIVFVMTRLIKALGDTFHGRHTFRQAFTVAAYGLSPILLLRMLDAIPGLSPWLTWGIGMVLSASILYYGLPPVMQPDPPHAFGLYMMTTLLLGLVTGLVRFLTAWYLQGKFARLDELISRIAAHLPF